MSIAKGTLHPIRDRVIVTDMEFGVERTESGIFLHADDGKSSGIHPRWAKVFAIGPEQKDVKVGEWILLEHGRWSRGHKLLTEAGEEISIRMADINAILMSADEKPSDVMRTTIGALNMNIPNA